MTDRTRLELAIWMAAKGFDVFTVKPGLKTPLHGNSWYARCTRDPAVIADRFEKTEDANFGIYPGEDHVVLDLDMGPSKNGIGIFDAICQENGLDGFLDLNTFTVATPNNGYHLYFKAPYPCGIANEFPDGIDVRGTNGYVVGPGSKLANGKEYRILDPDAEIMDLPDWLVAYMLPPGRKNPKAHELMPGVEWDMDVSVDRALEWLKVREPATEGQAGDDWTIQTALMCRDFGLSEENILWAMNEDWNGRCDPSWGDDELMHKIKNAFTYPQNRPGCKSPAFSVHCIQTVAGMGVWEKYTTPEAIAEMLKPTHTLRLVVNNTDGMDEVPDEVFDDERDPVTGEPAGSFPWYSWSAFAALDTVREYVINEWLLAHQITHMVAVRGTGKSTIALDMGAHIACDKDWCGVQTAKGWKVIYICGEDVVGMVTNVRAWAKYHDVAPTDDRFLIAADVISLTDEHRLDIRIKEMVDWADGARCVVILDTWQRATMGWSKNDMEAMEAAVTRAERIATYLNGPLLSLVHPPKDGRMTVKGAGEQEDTSGGIYHLEQGNGVVRLQVERIKGPGRDNYVKFAHPFEKVEIGKLDQFGNPISGIVPLSRGGSLDEGTQASKDRSKRELDAWATAIEGITKQSLGRYSNLYDMGDTTTMLISKVAKFLGSVGENVDGDGAAAADAHAFLNDWLEPLTEFLTQPLKEATVLRDLQGLFETTVAKGGADKTGTAETGSTMHFKPVLKGNKLSPKRQFTIEPPPTPEDP